LRGKFLSFEGGDGAGKSTQIGLLSEALKRSGITRVVTREPGGTPLAEDIRQWVLHETVAINATTEALLIFAARAQHTAEVIEPALEAGKWVLCDRYTDASYAYQGGGRGVPFEVIESLEAIATGGLKPDLTFFLELSVEEGVRRTGRRSSVQDRFEAQENEFKKRVRSAYQRIAAKDPHRVETLDGGKSKEDLCAEIRALVHLRLGVAID
jgi:dTMP kinase